jgi:hypothetical protein
MTSRELVLRTLDFEEPARIPRQMWLLPWAIRHHGDHVKRIQAHFPDDLIGSPYFCRDMIPGNGDPYEVGTYVDEWNCTFVNKQAGIIGEVKESLVASWQDLDKVKEPIEALSVDTSKVAEFCRGTDKFVMAPCCPRPFERLQFLRGTENVMTDLALGTDELFLLLDKIHQFYIKEVELWAGTDVDGIMFMDDWGSQQTMLISPAIWQDRFKPLYRQYIDITHAAGKKALMHSDGWIMDIIPDLIELKLDALNAQVFCMGLEELSSRFKGQITFWGEIDRQHLLPNARPEEIEKAVQRFNRCFYNNGGIIGQLEFGPGAKPDNVYAAFKAWDDFSNYQDKMRFGPDEWRTNT